MIALNAQSIIPRRVWRWVWAAALLLGCHVAASSEALAQQRSRTVPRDSYFFVMQAYYEGEYETALDGFQNEYRQGVQSTEGRWIDSICYHTMMGECLYQMGQNAKALEQFQAGLQLAVAHNGWMLRVSWPDINPSASNARSRITWGASGRNTAIAHIPSKMTMTVGRFDNANVIRQGGVVANPMGWPIRPAEIIRCTALALRRQAELLGPASRHDPVSARVLDALSKRMTAANSWSQSWMSAQLGMAHLAMGDKQQAALELQKSLVIGGRFDHALTSVSLLELGKIAMSEERFQEAGTLFMEATYAGAAFGQPTVMEEAFRHAATIHLATNRPGPFAPLTSAADWAAREKTYVQLRASLMTLAAETLAERGQTAAAAQALEQAERALKRREMIAGAVGARYHRVAAIVRYQQGNVGAGDTHLAALKAYERNSSVRLFQISLIDKLFLNDIVSERIANDLFTVALADPTSKDWAIDPHGALAKITTPPLTPMEHWFELLLIRRQPKAALEAADRVRRGRFYSTMPIGGRLLSLRWILEAPVTMLDQQARLQRQDLLARYPRYAELSQAAAAVRAELSQLPLLANGDDRDQANRQRELYQRLQQFSASQEVVLREMALRRGAADFVFPPVRPIDEVQSAMAPGKGALVFFVTQRGAHAFAFDHDNFNHWHIENWREVVENTPELLQQMGHFDGNQVIDAKDLREQEWKETSAQLLSALTNDASANFWDQYHQLAIVPDGVLWHLPFDAMQRPTALGISPLIAETELHYAPTASLVVGQGTQTPRNARTAVVVGKLFPRDGDTLAAEAWEELKRLFPDAARIGGNSPGPSNLMAALCDRLIVLDDIDDSDRTPYGWSPMQIDKATLSDWARLPFGTAEQVIVPAFHTAAESGLKRGAANGNEVFLTVCGLMSSGARTILLSRWRTGGQSSVDLVREFVQELPHAPASTAWRRSVMLSRHNPLDVEREPRVKGVDVDMPPSADHPFFWGGYMLIDVDTPAPKRQKAEN